MQIHFFNLQLITNSEEVAFYQGNAREKLTIFASFNKLTAHMRKYLEFRVGMGVVDNLVAKCEFIVLLYNKRFFFIMFYVFLITDIATGVGFYAVSIPFFDKSNTLLQDNQDGERLRVRN